MIGRLARVSLLSALACGPGAAIAQQVESPDVLAGQPASPSGQAVSAALADLNAWLGDGPNGDQWRRYLGIDALQRQLAKGADADPGGGGEGLERVRGGANGLDMAPFAQVRQRLSAWLLALKRQFADDLPQLALASRADHAPISAEQFAQVRTRMRQQARALEAWLSGDAQRARDWKNYLQWELLEPHLQEGFEANRRSLDELDRVLRRLRANEPGLELEPFTDLAKAIDRYRDLVTWAAAAERRETGPDFARLVTRMSEQLKRHLERPTTETAWGVGRILGVVDALRQSPYLVETIRDRLAQVNISAGVSEQFVYRLPNRPVNRVAPVHDCILGTSIYGQAHTVGDVRYGLIPSHNSVELAVYLDGAAHSTTRGYNGPVRINSRGRTAFTAVARLSLSEDAFTSSPATASANTNTTIASIQKTGGRFGARLIEKIAWRRACEQKRQAELIAAEHAEARVARELNESVVRDLADLRRRYENKIHDPLIRRGVSPEYLRMSSSPSGVMVEAVFAGRHQLAAAGPPPTPMPGLDLWIQIHQSALNNYFPLALASAKIAQETAENPPELSGDVPNWLKVLAISRPNVAAVAGSGLEIVEETQERIDQVEEAIDQAVLGEEEEAQTPPPFRPYTITLNDEAPVGVRFDDGTINIRVRAASLASEDAEYTDWDFIVTYRITADENGGITLVRVGRIEVFPTGFDPAWDRQLTAQQSGFRSTLAQNMNARAEAGQSFPTEIPIEPVRFSRVGALVLRQLVADEGWLTVGWTLQ